MNNNSMVPSTCKLEVPKKKKKCKITWAYGQKTLLKSPSNFERGARLTEVPSKSEGESTMMHPDQYKKAALLQMGCL